MSSVPHSSSQPSLKAGLAAVKQKDYASAIAHLEPVSQQARSPKSTVKAQMGLAIAYEGVGETDKAIALCQDLQHNKNQKVRDWSDRTLAKWKQRYPDRFADPVARPTGFVPLDDDGKPDSEKTTGFVPLDNSNEPDSKKTTGFVDSPNEPPRHPIAESESVPSDNPAPPSPPQPDTEPIPIQWRNAPRAHKWRSLKQANTLRLAVAQLGSAIALIWLLNFVLHRFMEASNDFLVWFPLTDPIQAFYHSQTRLLQLALLVLFVASPWLLDLLLKFVYGVRPLSQLRLKNRSPEAGKLLRRYCRKQHWQLPKLYVHPSDVPIAMTYGHLPRTARMVLSQGLLDRLEDDEIAAVIAAELGHIARWDFAVMSWFTVVTQIPYSIYRQVARGGDRLEALLPTLGHTRWKEIGLKAAVYLCLGVSTIAYGLYRLFRLPTFWISRLRHYYSDRFSAELTGNPNALTRVWLKSAIAIARDVRQQQHADDWLEGFDLLLPISPRQAIATGSLYPHADLTAPFLWDRTNSHAKWLVFNDSHPLLGDRLYILSRYAQFWKLDSELDWDGEPNSPAKPRSSFKMLLQGAPFFGAAAGLVVGATLMAIGWVGKTFDFKIVSWLFYDRGWLVAGLLLTGYSVGTFLRINSFFPDIRQFRLKTDASVPELASDPHALPIDSREVRLRGTLLGRRGLENELQCDLWLQTDTGLVKLHWMSKFGPIGNLFQPIRLNGAIGQTVTATGWLRRGSTLWIDVDTLDLPNGTTIRADPPVWSTLLASVAVVWGAYILWKGGV